jgi:hypothetical protein
VAIESALGKGTCVSLLFPASRCVEIQAARSA